MPFSSLAEKKAPILPEKSSAGMTASVKGKGYRDGHPRETYGIQTLAWDAAQKVSALFSLLKTLH
jgi:hypothetical protein